MEGPAATNVLDLSLTTSYQRGTGKKLCLYAYPVVIRVLVTYFGLELIELLELD